MNIPLIRMHLHLVMENKIEALCIRSMDFLGDDITILILAFVVFMLFVWCPPKQEQEQEQSGGGRRPRRGLRGLRGHRGRLGPRRGRRDFFGYYGDYWNVFNPWRINNPCANYAAKRCRGNYYYEPCYESKYYRCMNSTYYA